MRIKLRDTVFAISLCIPLTIGFGIANACDVPTPPAGATGLGYSRVLFNICPSAESISTRRGDHTKPLHSGLWFSRTIPARNLYSDVSGALEISPGGHVSSVPTDLKGATLPLLSGRSGFYIEFEVAISSNDQDHWPAVWLLPVEHDPWHTDHYKGDPKDFERYEEIDVDEGGFTPGPLASAIFWSGIWPHYTRKLGHSSMTPSPLDRTKVHVFGVGYDPDKSELTYWLDGRVSFTARGETVSPVINDENFYFILSNQSHGKSIPYEMYVYRVTAYSR